MVGTVNSEASGLSEVYGHERLPGEQWLPPIDAFAQHRKLCPGQRHGPTCCLRPYKLLAVETLHQKTPGVAEKPIKRNDIGVHRPERNTAICFAHLAGLRSLCFCIIGRDAESQSPEKPMAQFARFRRAPQEISITCIPGRYRVGSRRQGLGHSRNS